MFLVWTEAWKSQSIIALVSQHGGVVKETILVDNQHGWRKNITNMWFVHEYVLCSLPSRLACKFGPLELTFFCSDDTQNMLMVLIAEQKEIHGQQLFWFARGGHASCGGQD